MIIVHAGNRMDDADRPTARFPARQIDPVTATLERLLRDLAPTLVVSAPANGADLIVLAAAQRLGIPTHVVLPLPVDEFHRRSVAGPGAGGWSARYDEVLERAANDARSTVEVHDVGTDGEWHLRGNALLLETSRRCAGWDQRLVAVAVRPVEGEDPPSATDDFVQRARQMGITVLSVDPRPGRPTDVCVG